MAADATRSESLLVRPSTTNPNAPSSVDIDQLVLNRTLTICLDIQEVDTVSTLLQLFCRCTDVAVVYLTNMSARS